MTLKFPTKKLIGLTNIFSISSNSTLKCCLQIQSLWWPLVLHSWIIYSVRLSLSRQRKGTLLFEAQVLTRGSQLWLVLSSSNTMLQRAKTYKRISTWRKVEKIGSAYWDLYICPLYGTDSKWLVGLGASMTGAGLAFDVERRGTVTAWPCAPADLTSCSEAHLSGTITSQWRGQWVMLYVSCLRFLLCYCQNFTEKVVYYYTSLMYDIYHNATKAAILNTMTTLNNCWMVVTERGWNLGGSN